MAANDPFLPFDGAIPQLPFVGCSYLSFEYLVHAGQSSNEMSACNHWLWRVILKAHMLQSPLLEHFSLSHGDGTV
jgi:hypothetical protein